MKEGGLYQALTMADDVGRAVSRFDVLGVPISGVDLGQAVAFVRRSIENRVRTHVCVSTVNMVMQARRDAHVRSAMATAGLVVPDGYPLTFLGRRRSGPHVGRVRGTDFVRALASQGAGLGWRFFLYGGAPGIPGQMAARLIRDAPGLSLVGAESPPFGPFPSHLDAATVERINAANPDIVLVGLGCPKQERWMLAHRAGLTAPVLIGVGAAFDFLAGSKPEAPPWIQRAGLEWLWRFVHEPLRLWRRVLLEGPLFMALAARESWKGARKRGTPRDKG